mmetsp:Transcript_4935/g.14303  ORF Transcript_4935/g.14303 Transcript_4935/m.14303 type:complete len:207 (+) Transcript_4935:147-767(+)
MITPMQQLITMTMMMAPIPKRLSCRMQGWIPCPLQSKRWHFLKMVEAPQLLLLSRTFPRTAMPAAICLCIMKATTKMTTSMTLSFLVRSRTEEMSKPLLQIWTIFQKICFQRMAKRLARCRRCQVLATKTLQWHRKCMRMRTIQPPAPLAHIRETKLFGRQSATPQGVSNRSSTRMPCRWKRRRPKKRRSALEQPQSVACAKLLGW